MSLIVPAVVWFRNDLRLSDQPALMAAIACGAPILPVFIYDPRLYGSASRWWLHHSLGSLCQDLEKQGTKLVIRKGDPSKMVPALCREVHAVCCFFNRSYEPFGRLTERRVEKGLRRLNVVVRASNGSLLFDPGSIRTKQSHPYKVFTPFWNHLQTMEVPDKEKSVLPGDIFISGKWPRSISIKALRLLPKQDWAKEFSDFWKPGEKETHKVLKGFIRENLPVYPLDRNKPFKRGTSRLSAALHFGEISVRRLWHEVSRKGFLNRNLRYRKGSIAFLRQLAWREFSAHLLYHFPETVKQPLRKTFIKFQWKKNVSWLVKWQKGLTGYPIVDAGMRELWRTGWMHNRVRMIVGSFLVKDLLIDWKEGAKWFMDTLVDADIANNTFGWQWIAGCGADAAPYFRIFNPVLQGEKFDPEGVYVRRWIPELANMPAKWIHKPWMAPAAILFSARVKIGNDYPRPIIDHNIARRKALLAYVRLS